MIFTQEYFDKYCRGEKYEDTLDEHLMTYHRFCKAYSRGMDLSIPQVAHWLKSKCVLDAGCAMGHVVKDLWENGVEAWGFEPSKYCIENRVITRIHEGDNDTELGQMSDNSFDIIFANSFQYASSVDQLNKWIQQAYRVCSHSVLFNSVVKDDLQSSISINLHDMQIVEPRDWWNEKFQNLGFLRYIWVNPSLCIYFKD